MFLTVNKIFHQSVKSPFKMNCCHKGVLTHASQKWSLPNSFMIVNTFYQDPQFRSVQIICKIINSVGCPRHLTIASKLLRIKTRLGGVFWVSHGIFSIIRHLSREPDFSARNRIFKNFLKYLKACLVKVFSECFKVFFSIVRHLGREPDFLAGNRIFKKFLKNLKACLVGVFWVFQCIFSIVRHLSREPDFLAENRIFKKFLKSLKTCLIGVFWVFQGIF